MIRGVDHLGIAVRSIAEARRFYEALGLAVEAVEEVASEQVRVAMIPCGGTRIELLEATGPESPIARFIERRGPGLHHVCLASGDLASDDARLRGAGYELLRDQPSRGAGGCWVQFVHPKSAGGVLVELSQPAGEEGAGAVVHGAAEASETAEAGAAAGERPRAGPGAGSAEERA